MKTVLTVTIEMDADGADRAALEQDLRGWLESRPQVQGVTLSDEGAGNVAAWRRSREAAFGPALHNPFAPASRPG
ncbi:hypothetical protein M2352_001573 [Azospirillum fermentarium]|uniref:hypothetical protein n=1 Tax=Azospirillum fermentarium TaxID=1233114 RepID=UPI00222627CE|nr:hypothetical protein [Azospirillum fermentarium]MCW2245982.1 hypothetical protein [Azospirillum fermentarium]